MDRKLPDSWIGFTKFTCSGSGLQRFKQQPDLIICGLKFGPTCQKQLRREKNRNGRLKNPTLDNARKLRGTHFIDPGDGAYKETITMQERSWKFRWWQLCLARWERESEKRSRSKTAASRITESNKQNDKSCMHRGSS